jgi:hypothetical protein
VSSSEEEEEEEVSEAMAPARPRPVSRLRLKSESSEEVEDSLLIRASRLRMLALETHTRIRSRILLSVADPGYLSHPDPGFRIPDPTTKEEGENVGCLTFLCSHKFHKIVNLILSIADPGFLSRIPEPNFYPTRIPDPGSNNNKRGGGKYWLSYLFI